MKLNISLIIRRLVACGGVAALSGCAVYPLGAAPGYGYGYGAPGPAYAPYSVEIYGGGRGYYPERGYHEHRGWHDGRR